MELMHTSDLETVKDWIDNAPVGARLLYHVGFLAEDRYYRHGQILFPNQPLHGIALALWLAYVEGKVELFQDHYGSGALYYAEKRRVVRPVEQDFEW